MASAESKVSVVSPAVAFRVCSALCAHCEKMHPFWSYFNPFNWLLGRGATSDAQFINDKTVYDMNWVFPKLKRTNTRWWAVFSSMTIASVGFLSKMFIGESEESAKDKPGKRMQV